MNILSIIIPCYNEEDHILQLLNKIEKIVLPYDIQKEIIIVDDYSTDQTRTLLAHLDPEIYTIHLQDQNYGKWFAVRTGIDLSKGDYCIIQDADLEYDPQDYIILLETLIDKQLPVVYWSRRMNKDNKAYSGWIYYVGANITTILINLLYGSRLTDSNTCYKMFTKNALQWANFVSQKFDFDQEITSFFLQKYHTITEIPIRYYPRSSTEGKKINMYDFFHALDVILKLRFWFKKQQWTTLKIIFLWICSVWLFVFILALLYWSGRYQQHNYRSIALAFACTDLFAYWSIKFFFFGSTRTAIKYLIYNYCIHISSLLWVYFAGVFYFVEIAQGVWLYQGLFFILMSVLIVSGWNFVGNLLKGLKEME